MADIFSKKKRSEIMSKVRSKDSKIEIEFRKALWNAGFRYRKNSTKYFGKPDLVLKKYKTVIFIDSCFWHGCKKHGTIPKTRRQFWEEKINRNISRDKLVNRRLKSNGLKVIRVWEHSIKTGFLRELVNKISSIIIDKKHKDRL